MRGQLRIGEVAGLLGVTPKTIRHYEKLGLLQPAQRSATGYRLYGGDEIVCLVRIRRLQALGLPLARILEILVAPDQGHALRSVLEALSTQFDARIEELQERQRRIGRLLEDGRLNDIDTPTEAPLLLRDLMKQRSLPAYGPGTAIWEQDARIFATLEALRLPPGVAEQMKLGGERLLGSQELSAKALWLGERIAALDGLPEDAPEVEALARAALEQGIAQALFALVPMDAPAPAPFDAILGEVILAMMAPAQRRFLELIQNALRAAEGGRS